MADADKSSRKIILLPAVRLQIWLTSLAVWEWRQVGKADGKVVNKIWQVIVSRLYKIILCTFQHKDDKDDQYPYETAIESSEKPCRGWILYPKSFTIHILSIAYLLATIRTSHYSQWSSRCRLVSTSNGVRSKTVSEDSCCGNVDLIENRQNVVADEISCYVELT